MNEKAYFLKSSHRNAKKENDVEAEHEKSLRNVNAEKDGIWCVVISSRTGY